MGAALCLVQVRATKSERPLCAFFPLELAALARSEKGDMEQIETQASDLRYLTAPVAALSDSASVSYETPQPRPHMSPGSAMYGDNSALHDDEASPGDGDGNANKRKSVDEAGGAKQTRSKRNRVSLCNCRCFFIKGREMIGHERVRRCDMV